MATGLLGYFAMFTTFSPYDDEGYLLVSLRQYIAGGSLYRNVYAQYGPFYYEVVGGILRTLGHPVTTNDGRLFTLVLWVLASVLMGVTAASLTWSLPLTAATQMLSFFLLISLVKEPMHPQFLVALLVAGMVAVAAAVPPHRIRLGLGVLGALGLAIFLTKMNIGIFAYIALVFACVAAFSSPSPRLIRPLVYIAVAAAPLVLMLPDLSTGSVLRYAIVVSLGALTVVAVATAAEPASGTRTAWILPTAAGAAILAVVVVVVMVLQGVGLNDLIEGAFMSPIRQRPLLPSSPLLLPPSSIALGVLSSAVAVRWMLYRPRVPSLATALGKFAVGVTLWLTLLGKRVFLELGGPTGLGLAVALAWYSAVPIASSIHPASLFRRLFLATLAVSCSLQAYPVAGSQVGVALFAFVPLGALAFADGWRALEARLGKRSTIPAGRRMRAVFAGAVLFEVMRIAWLIPFRALTYVYNIEVPLRISAVDHLHLGADQAQTLEWLVRTLEQQCSTFVSYPGLNSLYVMTDMRPPSVIYPSDWMFLLDDAQQQAVVDAAQAIPRLCAVRNQALIGFWSRDRRRPVPDRPLVRFIESSFQAFASKGDYDVLLRK